MTDPVALARDLLRCPSVTPAEGGALAFLESVLAPAGFQVERPVFRQDGTPDVENLFARLGTAGPHLVFAGHTDVVPTGEVARWRHGPFDGTIEDGILYGRGAVDMKGAIACFAAAVLQYLGDNGPPPGSISFLITGDEEGPAVNGTVKLLDWAKARGEHFDHCLLGEPTNPERLGDAIKIGRRGSLSGTLIVEGVQGHVAYPHLADNPIRGLTAIMAALMAEPLDRGSAHFDASNLEFTSVDVGNKAGNVIPAQARARFNINDLHSPASLDAWMRARIEAAAWRKDRAPVAWRLDVEPSNSDVFLTEPGAFVDLVRAAIATETNRQPVLSTSGGTSDARFIKDHCPVVEFGLVGDTMHQIDERVPVADLLRLTAIYRRLLEGYFAPH
jgi:succinyl-diaminopimelate desuccinylase